MHRLREPCVTSTGGLQSTWLQGAELMMIGIVSNIEVDVEVEVSSKRSKRVKEVEASLIDLCGLIQEPYVGSELGVWVLLMEPDVEMNAPKYTS
eukprot:1151594-Pelagomonas_calceolata.AAC.2